MNTLRTFLLGIIILLSSNGLYADITSLPFRPGRVSILLRVSDNLKEIPVRNVDTQHYDIAFQNKDKTYEIRLISFQLTDKNLSQKQLETAFAAYAQMVIFNIAEDENNIIDIIRFDDAGVKEETNGDCGYAIPIRNQNGTNDFLKGYQYAMLNVFLKYDEGIVCKIIMFNDLSVMDDPNYSNDFVIFYFKSNK